MLGPSYRLDTDTGGDGSDATDPWQNWTPTITADTVNPTFGSGAIQVGRYQRHQNQVSGWGSIYFGTAGVSAGSGQYNFGLPVAPRVSTAVIVLGSGYVYDASAFSLVQVTCVVDGGGTVRLMLTSLSPVISNSIPWTWAANDQALWNFNYEVV